MPANRRIKKRLDWVGCGLLKPHYPGIFLERQENHRYILYKYRRPVRIRKTFPSTNMWPIIVSSLAHITANFWLTNESLLTWATAFTYRYFCCFLWLYFALLRPYLTLDVTVDIITQDTAAAMEGMAVVTDMGMGMVVVTVDMGMGVVTMVITKLLFLLSSEALNFVQGKVLQQSVFGTSIHLLTHSHIKARHDSVSEYRTI